MTMKKIKRFQVLYSNPWFLNTWPDQWRHRSYQVISVFMTLFSDRLIDIVLESHKKRVPWNCLIGSKPRDELGTQQNINHPAPRCFHVLLFFLRKAFISVYVCVNGKCVSLWLWYLIPWLGEGQKTTDLIVHENFLSYHLRRDLSSD